MTIRYADHLNSKTTPQSEPIPGENQVKNNAGGYVYSVDMWARLQRFLILGSDGGTFYVSEKKLTKDNAAVVVACADADAARTVNMIVEVSDSGRAPKNDPAILALSIVAASPDPIARALALAALPKVCRIPTHLFHFLAFLKAQRGFGPAVRKAVTQWYARWTPEQFAYEAVKYQQRDGWSHRDVFRQIHPKLGADYQSTMRWAIGAPFSPRIVRRKNQGCPKDSGQGVVYGSVPYMLPVIEAYERAKTASVGELVQLIGQHHLSREMVPSDKLDSIDVWNALLPNLGLTAILRNLNKMTAVGLLQQMSESTTYVSNLVTNLGQLRKARVHPLQILNAMKVYSSGKGEKGSLTWKPVQKIVDALNDAFYVSFGAVEPTGKRIMLALDVSGSMSAGIAGTALSCREACAALALVTANVESNYIITGFTNSGFISGKSQWGGYQNGISPLNISPKQRLDDVVRYLGSIGFGGTDCALPMVYAEHEKLDLDAFCVYTDNETWAGNIHPKQALASYRQTMNKPQASQIVIAMTPTEFSIADPADPRTLDVVGFDMSTPAAISEFIKG